MCLLCAAAAYAASAPAALPAEGVAKCRNPYCLAIDTAIAIPRALNVPVGFAPSSLTNNPSYRRLRSIGVHPSPSDTGATSGSTSA